MVTAMPEIPIRQPTVEMQQVAAGHRRRRTRGPNLNPACCGHGGRSWPPPLLPVAGGWWLPAGAPVADNHDRSVLLWENQCL